MAKRIYLVGEKDELRPMDERAYDSEDVLQELLERHPDVLAGTQFGDADAEPTRWLLVRREMPVPGEEGGSGRWSLDHLFLDRAGVPTLVEVKRATDTRARREVVAQMLDYAANAVLYWPVEAIVASFEGTVTGAGGEPDDVLNEFLAGGDRDAFWTRVKTNLAAERIRLVFVADEVPRELRRIIEFLNGQMGEAEVIGIEVKQYLGDGLRVLVPTLVGQTAKAREKTRVTSGGGPGIDWDAAKFDEAATASAGPEVAQVCRQIVDWFTQHAAGVRWGKGKKHATFTARAVLDGEDVEVLRVFANGGLGIAVGKLPERVREELRARIAAVPGIDLSSLPEHPDVNIEALLVPSNWQAFVATLTWLVSTTGKGGAAGP